MIVTAVFARCDQRMEAEEPTSYDIRNPTHGFVWRVIIDYGKLALYAFHNTQRNVGCVSCSAGRRGNFPHRMGSRYWVFIALSAALGVARGVPVKPLGGAVGETRSLRRLR